MGGGDERRKEKKGRTFTYTESDGENSERPTIRVFLFSPRLCKQLFIFRFYFDFLC
jgi:hypothetical protein